MVIIGPGDDAGVYMLDKGLSIVETVDIITPVVNEPFTFGAISAVNSLSDIYAMGGRPMTALALLGFSSCDYEPDVIKKILRGAIDILRKAGVSLMGGHSFEDSELKFGLSVTGRINEKEILRSKGAKAGDILILTKSIGVGVLSTTLKAGKIKDKDMRHAIDSMLSLNDKAASSALKAGATSATDVTGFGLLGHAYNMVRDSKVDFEINVKDVPVFDMVRDFIEGGMIPERAYNNLRFLEGILDSGKSSEEDRLLLSDPQTSGGLLISLSPEKVKTFRGESLTHWVIGRVINGKGRIRLT